MNAVRLLQLLLLPAFCPIVCAIIGFDCGGPLMNVTTVSLISAGECDLDIKDVQEEPVHIQLLQLADFDFTEIMQCQISVSRIVYYCGMHSHVSAVHNGNAEYLRDISHPQCKRMHLEGSLNIGNNILIEGLKINSTATRSVTLAGSLTNDGKCTGTTYSDPYGSWNDVIVLAIVKISLRSGTVPVKINTGKLTLKSGTTCNLRDLYCIDSENGHTFWNDLPLPTCNYRQYDVLYEGRAQKIKSNEVADAPTVYSLTTEDVTFALTKTTEVKFCGYTLFKTEHPKLFIMETKSGNSFNHRRPVAVENLDIFTYVNSKFIYVEKHVRTQMTALYNDVMTQKCELERQVISQALATAHLQPEEFAYTLMKGPGYMAVPAGEAAHIIKCIPVEVTLRPTEECYNELAVRLRNTSYFLTPKSHILKRYGTRRECNRLLPVMYKTHENWIRFLPKPIDAPNPLTIKPRTKLSWTYMTPEKLATSGIYSEKQLEELREHIMFPAEQPALINNVVQGMAGKQTLDDGMSIYNLLDEDALNKIAESATQRIWAGFITFGSFSAGLIGVFIVFRIIKLLIDTLIHGYALHSVYGCGLHLIGAVWSSVTHLLLHLARPPRERPQLPRNIEISAPIPIPAPHILEDHQPETRTSEETTQSEPIDNIYHYRELQRQLKEAQNSCQIP